MSLFSSKSGIKTVKQIFNISTNGISTCWINPAEKSMALQKSVCVRQF